MKTINSEYTVSNKIRIEKGIFKRIIYLLASNQVTYIGKISYLSKKLSFYFNPEFVKFYVKKIRLLLL